MERKPSSHRVAIVWNRWWDCRSNQQYDDYERSALVWLALLPGLFVIFMIGEFLVPLFD